MMVCKRLFSRAMVLGIFFALSAQALPQQNMYTDKVKGSMAGGLVGDALGRLTEFEGANDIMAIFKKYPGGVRSYADIRAAGKTFSAGTSEDATYAPYTDDTAMARVTLDVLIQARGGGWDMNRTMAAIAKAYEQDMRNAYTDMYGNKITAGWNQAFRAPGNCCKKNVTKIQNIKVNTSPTWWRLSTEPSQDGGCGSVMRAHPFGLVYADNPDKAAEWAAEHSCITHCAPIAKAACAAFAKGVAMAVNGESHETILNAMVAEAEKYDANTAELMRKAIAYAQKNKKHAHDLTQLFECSKVIFAQKAFLGWDARGAIAAATYIFAVVPTDAYKAVYLGVHTPGDSDSIASMAGALVGAYVGFDAVAKSWQNAGHDLAIQKFEGSMTLIESYPKSMSELLYSGTTYITKAATPPALKPVVFKKPTSYTSIAKTVLKGLAVAGIAYWFYASIQQSRAGNCSKQLIATSPTLGTAPLIPNIAHCLLFLSC